MMLRHSSPGPRFVAAALGVCALAAPSAFANSEDGGTGLVRIEQAYSLPVGRPVFGLWMDAFSRTSSDAPRLFRLTPSATFGLGSGFETSGSLLFEGIEEKLDTDYERRFDVRRRDLVAKLRWSGPLSTTRFRVGAAGVLGVPLGSSIRAGGTMSPDTKFDPGVVGLFSTNVGGLRYPVRVHGNVGYWWSRNDGAFYYRDFPSAISIPGAGNTGNNVFSSGVGLEVGFRRALFVTEVATEQFQGARAQIAGQENLWALTAGLRGKLTETIGLTGAITFDLSKDDPGTLFNPGDVFPDTQLRVGLTFGAVMSRERYEERKRAEANDRRSREAAAAAERTNAATPATTPAVVPPPEEAWPSFQKSPPAAATEEPIETSPDAVSVRTALRDLEARVRGLEMEARISELEGRLQRLEGGAAPRPPAETPPPSLPASPKLPVPVMPAPPDTTVRSDTTKTGSALPAAPPAAGQTAAGTPVAAAPPLAAAPKAPVAPGAVRPDTTRIGATLPVPPPATPAPAAVAPSLAAVPAPLPAASAPSSSPVLILDTPGSAAEPTATDPLTAVLPAAPETTPRAISPSLAALLRDYRAAKEADSVPVVAAIPEKAASSDSAAASADSLALPSTSPAEGTVADSMAVIAGDTPVTDAVLPVPGAERVLAVVDLQGPTPVSDAATRALLEKIAAALVAAPGAKVALEVFGAPVDSDGDIAGVRARTTEQALSIREYLIIAGVRPDQVVARGEGPSAEGARVVLQRDSLAP